MLSLVISVQVAYGLWRSRVADERGQATAEYALVLLGAAAVAVMFTAWAASSGKVGDLLDKVFDALRKRIT